MKHIYLNLKRFDIPTEMGGVNRLARKHWGHMTRRMRNSPCFSQRATF